MAAVPPPLHIAAAALVGAGSGGYDDLVDAALFGMNQPSCSAYNAAGATIPSGGANATLIGLDSTEFDKDPLGLTTAHSLTVHPSRVTLNYTGIWLVRAFVRFPSNATGYRQLDIRVNANGSPTGGVLLDTVPIDTFTSGIVTRVTYVGLTPRVAGDYLELFGYQTSGSSLTTTGGQSANLSVVRVSGG